MKKLSALMLALWLVLLLLFSACSANTAKTNPFQQNFSEQDIGSSKEGVSEELQPICTYELPEDFDNIEDLLALLSTDEEFLEKASQAPAALRGNSREPEVYVPVLNVFEEKFPVKEFHTCWTGSYLNYHFDLDVNLEALAEEYDIGNPEWEEEQDALFAAGENGEDVGEAEPEINYFDLESCCGSMAICCQYNPSVNGETVLNSFAFSNPVEAWEDHPGYYYTRAPYLEMDDPLAYMIYWVYDSTYFYAAVPAFLLDTFWENVDSLVELAPVPVTE